MFYLREARLIRELKNIYVTKTLDFAVLAI